MEKPNIKPKNPNFSSGPCSKRPGWSFDVLKNSPIGRSHRHKVCKEKLNEVIVKSKKILQLPDGYHVGIVSYIIDGPPANCLGFYMRVASYRLRCQPVGSRK